MSIPLAVLEDIIDASGAAPAIEALLPAGVRRRQLTVRTLLRACMLTLADDRPAHLTRVHAALHRAARGRPGPARRHRGLEDRAAPAHLPAGRAHLPPGRQGAGQGRPDGAPSGGPAVSLRPPAGGQHPRRAQERQHGAGGGLDRRGVLVPAAPARQHRMRRPRSRLGAPQLQPARPQRRDVLRLLPVSRHHGRRGERPGRARAGPPDDPRRLRPGPGPRPGPRPAGDARSRHPARRHPGTTPATPTATPHAWAIPLRHAGAQLVQDLHPHDRGPRGTHHGAIIANGNLYCPATPHHCWNSARCRPAATPGDTAAHDQQTAELARHKLGRLTADDADGYHRVTCPAAAGKIRCPLRPDSMTAQPGPARDPRPRPATRPPAAPSRPSPSHPDVAAKTRQKHDYPSAAAPAVLRPAHRRRAHLLHHQRPRHHQHRPRLVPPHRPHPAHALARLPARRPQPAHPGRLRRPPGRQRPPRRRRAAAPNPQTAPHQPRHARRRPAITTRHDQPAHPRAHAAAPPARLRLPTAKQTPRHPHSKITQARATECQSQM